MGKKKTNAEKKISSNIGDANYSDETEPDWTKKCENCGQTPIVPLTGLCGPCTFGEADTAGGNW